MLYSHLDKSCYIRNWKRIEGMFREVHWSPDLETTCSTTVLLNSLEA